MAYNKSKGKQKHGDVIYDKDTDTQIDFEPNEIRFRTGGTIRGSFTNGGLSVTGSYITAGAISASLGVTGSSLTCDGDIIGGVDLTVGDENSAKVLFKLGESPTAVKVTGAGSEYFRIDTDDNNFYFRQNSKTRFGSHTVAPTNTVSVTGDVSASVRSTFHELDVGEGTLTVSKEGVVASSGSISGTVLSGSGFATLYGLNVGQGVMTVNAAGATATKNLTATGIISGSSTATLFALNVGQGTLTVSNQGLLSSSAIPTLKGVDIGQGALTVNSAGRLSSSVTPTLTSLDIGEGTFTVGKEGAIKSSGSLNVSGHTSLGITGSLVPLHVNGATQQILITSQLGSVVAGTSIAQINFGSSVNSSNFYTGAKIEALGDDAWDLVNNSSPTKLTLSTVPSGSATARSRLAINSSGTVGIGDNFYPTTNALLHVSASTQEYNLYVAGGKVGINTATLSSSAELTVSGTVSATTMSASSNVNVGGTLNAANSGFMVDADGDTTVKSLTAAAGDVKGVVISGSSTATLFGLNVGQGAFTVSPAGATLAQDVIAASFSSSVGTGSFAGGLNVAENFIVLPSGSVGIGTSTPAYDLHVNGSGVTVATIDGGAGADAYLKLATNGVEKAYVKLGSGGNLSIVQDAAGGDMIFKAKPGGASTEFLRYNAGDSAISASQDLYVSGDITGSTALVVGGIVSGSGHAVFDTISIGKDVSSAADRGTLQIEAQHDELMFIVSSATNPLIIGVTGSAGGQVTVGGAHLDAKFNVTGSDIDKLISAKSDTANPAFYVSGSGDLYASGKIGIGTNDPLTKLDVNGNSIRIRTANTPASASALGAPGEIRWDANYIYICISTDTWRRIAHASW